MKDTLISVNELYRYYGDFCAVNNLNFIIERGEVLGFLGPNGAGKTTTMQILSGVLAPSSGKVTINGIDIQENPRDAKRHLGFLPEQPPLYPDLTVDEYLQYAASLRGIYKSAASTAIENCKQRCGLEKSGKRLIRNLSRGYMQRAGIAQAIIHSPAVIILDEPTSGLDPIQIREIRALIKELGKDHSVILSTHILPEVQSVCNRVLIIHEGKLVFDQNIETMNDTGRNAIYRVAFRQPPAIETISSIGGIKHTEKITEQRFLIEVENGSNAIDAITQRAVNSCWGMFELTPQSDSLEEIFVRLTSGEHEKNVDNGIAA